MAGYLAPECGWQVGQGEGQLEGLQGPHRIFADRGGVEIKAVAKQHGLCGQTQAVQISRRSIRNPGNNGPASSSVAASTR
jgi:hypothetical protein